jgi:hypothetical protein
VDCCGYCCLRRYGSKPSVEIARIGLADLRYVKARSLMRAVRESGLSEGPDSLIKRPNFKTIYNFLIKGER